MLKIATLTCAALCFSTSAAMAGPESCGDNYWTGSSREHAVDAVSRSSLQVFLHQLPAADGIGFMVKNTPNELWLDIVSYPGDVTVAASTRVLFIVGRVTRPEYKLLVLADNGIPLFKISYEDIHRIGCQFVWGEEGGQNPIALMRELVDSLRHYENGERVAPEFTGSLLGDTTLTIDTLNKIVTPMWVMRTVNIE